MDRLTNRTDQFFDPATQAPIGDGQARTIYAYSANSQLLNLTDDNTNRTSYTAKPIPGRAAPGQQPVPQRRAAASPFPSGASGTSASW